MNPRNAVGTDRSDVDDDEAAGHDDDAEGDEKADGEEENIVADVTIQPVGAAAATKRCYQAYQAHNRELRSRFRIR